MDKSSRVSMQIQNVPAPLEKGVIMGLGEVCNFCYEPYKDQFKYCLK